MDRKIPTHQQTHARLRDMILFGDLAPGQAVTIQGLAAQLDAGMTPVREAIRRLTAAGALEALDNRRICVPRLGAAGAGQLRFARLAIEPELARRAALGAEDPDALVQRLLSIDSALDKAIAARDIRGYLRGNHAFHFALYGAAGAGVLLDLAAGLWLRFGPSLRVVISDAGGPGQPDRHQDACRALAARKPEAVAAALAADIADGADAVARAIAAGRL